MRWDPVTTVRNALWIGGGQWSGKSTVAGIIADRHGLTHYHYDYHDARGHQDRRVAARLRRGESPGDPHPDRVWVTPSPQEMASTVLAGFPERFEWVLDDLRALGTPRPVIVDGWGIRPELVVRVAGSPRQMVVLVPTEEFRRHQLAVLPRAGTFNARVSDPVKAQRNRVARDGLIIQDVTENAKLSGVIIIEVDGSRGVEATAEMVADHFSPFLA
ncbi:hypothetical protein [Winogradskya consettensis]|nr:hypothetical protein [Actinoplanes consettensis]